MGMMDAAQHRRDAVEWNAPVQGLPSDSFPSAVLLTKDDGKEIALNRGRLISLGSSQASKGQGFFK